MKKGTKKRGRHWQMLVKDWAGAGDEAEVKKIANHNVSDKMAVN